MEVLSTEHFGIARKIISNMTTESWQTIPHVCITYDADVTAFMAQLKEINEGRDKTEKITVNTAMLRVIVEGLKYCPSMNGHIQFNRKLVRGTVKILKNIDISMPVILKTGEMMTINMHGMQDKSMSQMRDAISDSLRRANNSNLNEVMYEVSIDNTIQGLKKGRIIPMLLRLIGSKTGRHKIHNLKGKEKKKYYSIPESERLTKHDIEQGTITVSNMGSVNRNWNGQCTILEIVPPQLTAIAFGAATQKPVCKKDGTISSALIMPVTIAFDHRALDTADIMPFIDKLDEIFAHSEIIKTWI